ncbi:tetraspanin-33-like isoform X1 [Dermacentor albipictus]|uniref:tetraspanin-33-like isoform X1 n=1 Tax=Dermacentor albipictus TaxID=60249 RepID=UPI0031FC9BBB
MFPALLLHAAKRQRPTRRLPYSSLSEATVRYPLLLFNLALWSVGVLLMSVATVLLVNSEMNAADAAALAKLDLSPLVVTHVELAVFVVGLALFIVTTFGCVGALRENTALLRMYSFVLVVLVIASVFGGIVVFFMPGEVRKVIKQTMSLSLVTAYRDSADSEQIVDALQRQLHCCGMTDLKFRDWNANIYFNCSADNPSHERCAVPYSCCRRRTSSAPGLLSRHCGHGVLNQTDQHAWHRVYLESCPDAAYRYIKENVTVIGGCCLIAAIVLSFVDMMTGSVIGEIEAIRKIYGRIRSTSLQQA